MEWHYRSQINSTIHISAQNYPVNQYSFFRIKNHIKYLPRKIDVIKVTEKSKKIMNKDLFSLKLKQKESKGDNIK